MEGAAARSASSSFDVVGRYSQDQVNGFHGDVVESLLEAVQPETAEHILDAMAGDGNLTRALAEYCAVRGIAAPHTTVLEYSQVQAEFARALLDGLPVSVVWADMLSYCTRDTGELLPREVFDRVMIKSANHEIPQAEQQRLYENVFHALKPGGHFVNLGFLFHDPIERDEFRSIARVKDTLAEMHEAAQNRHFLTSNELYRSLRDRGFVDVRSHRSIEYRICSEPVAKTYFSGLKEEEYDIEHQVAQIRARVLRARGRIVFDGTTSTMHLPGEITVARRPTFAEQRADQFARYPYLFLRHIAAHRELMASVQRYTGPHDEVLDLGCGPGLLAERLDGVVRSYEGIDADERFIASCRERCGHNRNFHFTAADLNEIDLSENRYSLVSILNVLYLPGVDAVRLLQRALAALKPGGRLIVSGPTDPSSFERAAPSIRKQLLDDGLLPEHRETFEQICAVNAELLSRRGNYWSVEGCVELLRRLGVADVREAHGNLYYGNSYFIAVHK